MATKRFADLAAPILADPARHARVEQYRDDLLAEPEARAGHEQHRHYHLSGRQWWWHTHPHTHTAEDFNSLHHHAPREHEAFSWAELAGEMVTDD